jgi:hypothetical protein
VTNGIAGGAGHYSVLIAARLGATNAVLGSGRVCSAIDPAANEQFWSDRRAAHEYGLNDDQQTSIGQQRPTPLNWIAIY